MPLVLAAAATSTLSAVDISTAMQHYPSWALLDERSAAALMDVMTNPSGVTTYCKVIPLVGDEKLATEFCTLLKRAKVKPAHLANGEAVHGWTHGIYKMCIPDTTIGDQICALHSAPDYTLTVNFLPEGATGQVGKLILAVDANGVVTDCQPTMGVDKTLLPAAVCKWPALSPQPVRQNAAGLPVPYVTAVRIELVVFLLPSTSTPATH